LYILSISGKSTEGAFCVIDDDGEKALYFFEDYDDADRYAGLLEAEDYPEMEVVEVNAELAIKTCEMYNYHYVVVKPDDVVIPPKEDVIYSNN
jgi:hypothetical protein